MAESGFSPIHASQFMFAPIDPNNPMNEVYARQVEEHARRHPYDAHAQAQLAHWTHAVMQARLQQQQMAAAAATARAQASNGFVPGSARIPGAVPVPPAPVPSSLFGTGPSPTPPVSGNLTAEVRAPGIHHGSSEQGYQSTPNLQTAPPSAFHTPSQS